MSKHRTIGLEIGLLNHLLKTKRWIHKPLGNIRRLEQVYTFLSHVPWLWWSSSHSCYTPSEPWSLRTRKRKVEYNIQKAKDKSTFKNLFRNLLWHEYTTRGKKCCQFSSGHENLTTNSSSFSIDESRRGLYTRVGPLQHATM